MRTFCGNIPLAYLLCGTCFEFDLIDVPDQLFHSGVNVQLLYQHLQNDTGCISLNIDKSTAWSMGVEKSNTNRRNKCHSIDLCVNQVRNDSLQFEENQTTRQAINCVKFISLSINFLYLWYSGTNATLSNGVDAVRRKQNHFKYEHLHYKLKFAGVFFLF